jgi:probable F420-dependent oxidoreductase
VRAFRFGVSARTFGSAGDWIGLARRAEALGYSTLNVPDHLTTRAAPLLTLAAAATVTSRLRVGTLVLNNDFRHPVLLAREAATLDVLSGGRLDLGLGAGYAKAEYDEAGLPYERGATRVERLAESVRIIKQLFEGGPVTFAGRHYQVAGHTIHPRPVQQPRPPILIGGNGPRLLALAAAEADIVGFSGITFTKAGTTPDIASFRAPAVDDKVHRLRLDAGERFDGLELNGLVQRVVLTGDRRDAAEELARRWTILSIDDILDSPFVLLGSPDAIAAQLVERRARWGISYWIVFEDAMEAFAPVVARLAGR